MTRADLAQVVAIETASFGSPWPAGAFLEEIRSNKYARSLVARRNRPEGGSAPSAAPVEGYICYWILADELLINNIAVRARARRLGIGRALLRHALGDAEQAGCVAAYLEVRPANVAAIRLYEAHGFTVVQRRKRYYADTGEDALVMRAALKGLETG
ncbi:MAG TPA: ribosomal protein S18-alanine N-acetyltransferase [Candidatus Polarisedimenticolia bacterium]|nr:ribosomal protein S18-alanine N-acetyltransferase [Candidatus Polarisedimenticolia bacterium]